jgi:hypothetical protein
MQALRLEFLKSQHCLSIPIGEKRDSWPPHVNAAVSKAVKL